MRYSGKRTTSSTPLTEGENRGPWVACGTAPAWNTLRGKRKTVGH